MNDAFSDFDKIENAHREADIENHTIRVFVVYFSLQRVFWIDAKRAWLDSDCILKKTEAADPYMRTYVVKSAKNVHEIHTRITVSWNIAGK